MAVAGSWRPVELPGLLGRPEEQAAAEDDDRADQQRRPGARVQESGRPGEAAGQHREYGGNPAGGVRVGPAPEVESAASPVSVMVSTVVVRSGTASRRIVELRTPMPNASTAMIV